MAPKNKPYEQFGPFILFKKLEADSLSELWRAARIEGSAAADLVAVRRFTGGDREALNAAVASAREIVPQLSGTSFVKHQIVDAIGGVPFLAYDYAGGRSLRHIVDRARGTSSMSPNPIPLDQAIAIAEKVALSLATTEEMRVDGHRLAHGALIPQFVWITDDGEIRVAGHGLGAGLAASLRSAPELARYVAPEMQQSGSPTKASDVYAMGALLFLLTTGSEPPDAASPTFASAVHSETAFNSDALPADIRAIVEKSLTLDPAVRYASMADMKQAISALVHGGNYSATTFNLAFYVSNLLKKEIEGEALDRDRESKLNIAPYLDAPPAPVAAAAAPAAAMPSFASVEQAPAKSRMPLAMAAGVAVVVLGAGAYFMFAAKSKQIPPQHAAITTAQMVPVQKKAPISVQPLLAATPAANTAAATNTAGDEATRKKAFEDAVQQKLQEEMMKLQQDYTKSLQKQQSKNAPVQVASNAPQASSQRVSDDAPSAAQLDQQRVAAQPQLTQTAPAATHSAVPQQAPQIAEQPAAAPAHAVHEGDVIDLNDVDTPPHVAHAGSLSYPPMALRQHAEATIFVTALIDENGNVDDVRVLRGDKRFGFEDAALRAVRSTKFTAPTKDGKRVKSWFPVPVAFKLP